MLCDVEVKTIQYIDKCTFLFTRMTLSSGRKKDSTRVPNNCRSTYWCDKPFQWAAYCGVGLRLRASGLAHPQPLDLHAVVSSDFVHPYTPMPLHLQPLVPPPVQPLGNCPPDVPHPAISYDRRTSTTESSSSALALTSTAGAAKTWVRVARVRMNREIWTMVVDCRVL